jgi:tRNA1(Val) A37 N6-methylase TrmN6
VWTLARKSASYNGLKDRYDIREGDFRESGVLHADERFDLITGSPPYFPLEAGVKSEHPQRVACRFEAAWHGGGLLRGGGAASGHRRFLRLCLSD